MEKDFYKEISSLSAAAAAIKSLEAEQAIAFKGPEEIPPVAQV